MRGPVGLCDLRDVPDPVCLCFPEAAGAAGPTLIGISVPPPAPAASVTCNVTAYWPALANVVSGDAALEFGAPPSKFQL